MSLIHHSIHHSKNYSYESIYFSEAAKLQCLLKAFKAILSNLSFRINTLTINCVQMREKTYRSIILIKFGMKIPIHQNIDRYTSLREGLRYQIG